jgi:hypothetical protein
MRHRPTKDGHAQEVDEEKEGKRRKQEKWEEVKSEAPEAVGANKWWPRQ